MHDRAAPGFSNGHRSNNSWRRGSNSDRPRCERTNHEHCRARIERPRAIGPQRPRAVRASTYRAASINGRAGGGRHLVQVVFDSAFRARSPVGQTPLPGSAAFADQIVVVDVARDPSSSVSSNAFTFTSIGPKPLATGEHFTPLPTSFKREELVCLGSWLSACFPKGSSFPPRRRCERLRARRRYQCWGPHNVDSFLRQCRQEETYCIYDRLDGAAIRRVAAGKALPSTRSSQSRPHENVRQRERFAKRKR
jgi:hypothetical protein